MLNLLTWGGGATSPLSRICAREEKEVVVVVEKVAAAADVGGGHVTAVSRLHEGGEGGGGGGGEGGGGCGCVTPTSHLREDRGHGLCVFACAVRRIRWTRRRKQWWGASGACGAAG